MTPRPFSVGALSADNPGGQVAGWHLARLLSSLTQLDASVANLTSRAIRVGQARGIAFNRQLGLNYRLDRQVNFALRNFR